MGASNPYNSGESSSSAKPELADFLLARMKELRVTFRVLEASTPMMKRTRLHCILHSDTAKRRPMRVDEAQAICAALGVWKCAAASAAAYAGLPAAAIAAASSSPTCNPVG